MQQRQPGRILHGDIVQHSDRICPRLIDQRHGLYAAEQLDMGDIDGLRDLTRGFAISFYGKNELDAYIQLAAVDCDCVHCRCMAGYRADRVCVHALTFLNMRKADRYGQAAQPAAAFRLVQNRGLHGAGDQQTSALRPLILDRRRPIGADHPADIRKGIRYDGIRAFRTGRDARQPFVVVADACLIQFH